MRSFILALATVAVLAGLPTGTASAQTRSALPTCDGTRVARQPVYAQGYRNPSAYIHLFYDARTDTACAFLNSSNRTWGTSKHMTIQLKHCAGGRAAYGSCDRQLQSTAVRGWYSGRTNTATLKISRGCMVAWGRLSWGSHYALTATKPYCVTDAGSATR
ncbi:hypothetical protein [Rhizohabitans arisaemae]|uniref:hypothetical protein n=1 Tax=Rhizohabitans arisaemae TaxID=2720610 RepID=UPI0024B17B79|nr:hypothetical protein [Rhizohabitans arisaemae]